MSWKQTPPARPSNRPSARHPVGVRFCRVREIHGSGSPHRGPGSRKRPASSITTTIGTEHLLLGIVHDGEGVAAKVIISLDVSLDELRDQVIESTGEGSSQPTGHMPFTPRAKKVLELALREALQLAHNSVGSEHILLGFLREGEGVAAQVLERGGLSLDGVRQQVIQLLSGYPAAEPVALQPDVEPETGRVRAAAAWVGYDPRGPRRWWTRRRRPSVASPACSWCGADRSEAARHQTLPVPQATGERTRNVVIAFCSRCGTAVSGQVRGDGEEGEP